LAKLLSLGHRLDAFGANFGRFAGDFLAMQIDALGCFGFYIGVADIVGALSASAADGT